MNLFLFGLQEDRMQVIESLPQVRGSIMEVRVQWQASLAGRETNDCE